MFEEWRPVVGYEGFYEVSNLGQIRSLSRIVNCAIGAKRKTRGRVLRQSMAKVGYFCVNLSKNNRTRVHYVHALVLEAFVGPRPEKGYEGRRDDGDRSNNSACNLWWGARWKRIRTVHHCPVR